MALIKRLWDSFDTINLAQLLLQLGLVMLALALQALGLAGFEADTTWKGIAHLFAQTAPLTLAFMVMIPSFVEGITTGGADGYLMAVLMPCVTLIIATSIAAWVGDLSTMGQPVLIEMKLAGPPDWVIRGINLLAAYYWAYGIIKFWSSLVLAVILLAALQVIGEIWKSR